VRPGVRRAQQRRETLFRIVNVLIAFGLGIQIGKAHNTWATVIFWVTMGLAVVLIATSDWMRWRAKVRDRVRQ
jgi:uncharacterized membrane protein